jgi:hypothetical protein
MALPMAILRWRRSGGGKSGINGMTLPMAILRWRRSGGGKGGINGLRQLDDGAKVLFFSEGCFTST